MPNICMNILRIRGTKKQREEFKAKYCELVKVDWRENEILMLDFNKVIPEPETIKECPEEYLLRNEQDAARAHLEWNENNPRRWFNWYKFRCEKWFCKWPGAPYDSTETKTMLRLDFDTPWGPPLGIIGKLIRDNPELKISGRFDEPNMECHGSYSYKNYEKYFK